MEKRPRYDSDELEEGEEPNKSLLTSSSNPVPQTSSSSFSSLSTSSRSLPSNTQSSVLLSSTSENIPPRYKDYSTHSSKQPRYTAPSSSTTTFLHRQDFPFASPTDTFSSSSSSSSSQRTTVSKYVPPHRQQQQSKDIIPGSIEHQQRTWNELRKHINGIINKINASNIADLLPSLFQLNLVRGRGIFVQAIMKAQMISPLYTNIYTALVAVINTKLPEIGELLLKRVLIAFRQAYQANHKLLSVTLAKFLAHCINQQIIHELVALELLTLLLEVPTEDSVQVAVDFLKECGQILNELTPAGTNAIFDRLRFILQEENMDKRIQYMIETLFTVRKNKFSDYPSVIPALDLVETEDQITHELSLGDTTLTMEHELNAFHEDNEYLIHEAAWQTIQNEILGNDNDDNMNAGNNGKNGLPIGAEELYGIPKTTTTTIPPFGSSSHNTDNDDDDDDHDETEGAQIVDASDAVVSGSNGTADGSTNTAVTSNSSSAGTTNASGEIIDLSETDLVNLRRTIYLTIMSSIDYEECAHKLLKINIPKGTEIELCNMLIECCSQERTFMRYYGLLGQRFCMINQIYQDKFEECFTTQYTTIHRLETNKLRNVAKFFSHLLQTDALPWTIFSTVKINEDETNPSSRIFLKILCQELAEYLGLVKLRDRFTDPYMTDIFSGMFPRDSLRNTRFAINYFTSIGLGALTDDLREFLKQKMAEQQQAESNGTEG